MSRQIRILGILVPLGLCAATFGDIINVPGDQPTIQAAIDAASDGDEIVVAPGTYFENINLLGKAITLRSSDGPEVTTIDADDDGTVVTCDSDEGPDTVLDGFTIKDGNAFYGGGMYLLDSSPTVIRCIFEYNVASYGGGMYNESASPTVTDCTFSENWVGQAGGGMYNESASPTVTNCTFSGNVSYHWGGGMFNLEGSNPTVTNCTFSGNSADIGGGGMFNATSNPTVTNCILWNNSYVQIEDGFEASTTVRYSDVQYGWPGEGNIDADPLFVDPDNEDYHLLPGTPCIDAGDNTAVPSGVVTDLDGNLRFVDVTCVEDSGNGTTPIVDMGPYEDQFDSTDCNDNGEPDLCDIIEGTSGDCNLNGIPDDCEESIPDTPCDDDDACTENDTCSNGVCNGTRVECNDDNPCTDDSCDPSQGCVYTANNEPCDDGNACTTGDTCVNGGCVGSPPLSDNGLRYVDDDGVPDNCCTSWDDACRELQTALSLAESGDQIRVAAGVYKPDYDIPAGQHTGDRAATFQLISGVALRGGYLGLSAGPSEDPDERNIELHETILSGDLLGNDGPDFQNNDENSWHVVTGSETDDTATIEGFTLTGGNANGTFPDDRGGGMFNLNGSPTVTDSIFSGNEAVYTGGGMYNEDSSPALTGCTFSGNEAVFGGGVYNHLGRPAFTDCTFSGNEAENSGGGVHQASTFGGAGVTFSECAFIGNVAGSVGGGMYTGGFGYPPVLTNCVFTANTSPKGGGMYAYWSQGSVGATVTNCLFMQNFADVSGGGFFLYRNSPTLTNCTFWGNTSGLGGGIFATFLGVSEFSVSNCILWGNSPNSISASPATTVNYSDVQGGWPGEGNIDADPLFVDAANGDLHLSTDSPCIDAGDNTAVPADTADLDEDGDTDEPIPVDLDGNPRSVDDPSTPDCQQFPEDCGDCPVVDMGAYEFQEGVTDCCSADLNGDGVVGAADLAELLGAWGPNPGHPADLNGDDIVNAADLAQLLGAWGGCPG